jgi:pimeloyl-ACP methyl ester carboxylesterase
VPLEATPPDRDHTPAARSTGRVAISGRGLSYTIAGSGEPLVLVHGLGGTRETWNTVLDDLAADYTVIAPDLPGHGDSDAPGGDYSIGAYAAALRDLLVALGHRSATIVGHSLGGGIALQFAYQFPERTDRLGLISSGGLGPQLTPALRAATLPGAATVVAGMALVPEAVTRRLLPVMTSMLPRLLARADTRAVAEGLHRLSHAGQRRTFVRTARTVIDWRGQTISATRNLAHLTDLPVLLAWGAEDRTIPPHHHRDFAGQLTAPHIVEIDGAGHYPHETAPQQLLPALRQFLATTEPFKYTEARWRELMAADRQLTRQPRQCPPSVDRAACVYP